jgi:hypothetical protein
MAKLSIYLQRGPCGPKLAILKKDRDILKQQPCFRDFRGQGFMLKIKDLVLAIFPIQGSMEKNRNLQYEYS